MKSLALILFLFLVLPLKGQDDKLPNFVLIFADDQGYADVGCYGSPNIKTPNLDRMAREGMRFTDFYAQPICGPSRAAIMTGCYPLRLAERGNVKNVHPVLHEKEITLAEILKTKGYATGCFGKWDLAKHSQRGFHPDLMPNHQGFDYFFGTPSSNDSIVDLYRNEKRIELAAKMSTLTKRYTDEAIQFIQANKNGPFFVYVPHTMPHTKLAASENFRGNSERGLYGDVIEEIDHSVGRILSELEALDLVDTTFVFYTSDNGPWLIKNKGFVDGATPTHHGGSASPLRSGKVSTWEGGVRVPALAWAPGRVPAGRVCSGLATTLDILPTFAHLAEAAVPQGRVIDGKDISHLLRGEFDKADPDKTYYYYFLTHLQAVRQGDWKLHLPRPQGAAWLGPFAKNQHIHPSDDVGFDEAALYNLAKDIGETRNVATDHPDIVKRLQALAEDARKDIGDHDQVGENMRFFDPVAERPKKPVAAFLKRKRK